MEQQIQDAPYARAWDSYRRRNRISNVLTIAFIGSALGGSFLPHNILVTLGVCLLMFPVNIPLMNWPCPRCGTIFFVRPPLFRTPFAKKCWKCGLKKWSVRD